MCFIVYGSCSTLGRARHNAAGLMTLHALNRPTLLGRHSSRWLVLYACRRALRFQGMTAMVMTFPTARSRYRALLTRLGGMQSGEGGARPYPEYGRVGAAQKLQTSAALDPMSARRRNACGARTKR